MKRRVRIAKVRINRLMAKITELMEIVGQDAIEHFNPCEDYERMVVR